MPPEPLASILRQLEAGAPPAPDSGFLGADPPLEASRLVLLPVPWDATTSYRPGTANGPEAIRVASHQLDLEDPAFGRPYTAGIHLLRQPLLPPGLNRDARAAAERAIQALESGTLDPDAIHHVNQACTRVMDLVHQTTLEHLAHDRFVAVVGGDHSTPFGLIRALAETQTEPFGLLQIDAHHDFREAYEGFTWSHASIAHNLFTRLPGTLSRIVQVGIRDYSRGEAAFLESLGGRARCFHAATLFRWKATGIPFAEITRRLLDPLPERVHVSFDIDGLEPACCPSTGTPVPGGLSFAEAAFLLEELAASGRQVIGFDLCEVAPDPLGNPWDANVGARLLYKLCGCLLRSRGWIDPG